MSVKLKPLDQQVIVITGATSGIGLATARAAAQAGARLVLAARSGADLARVARALGGERRVATAVADVARPEDIARVADTARAHFGGFDTWVNNAGVGMWGRLEQGNLADFKRLYDTNFWGCVNGSLEAVKHLKAHGGALINLGSVASDVPLPIEGMYASSKHAVKAFTSALRMELAAEQAPISVTLIKPAAINTPFPEHARNYLREKPKLPQPVYAPEEVAYAILQAARHPVRTVYVGGGGKLMSSARKLAPATYDWLDAQVGIKAQMQAGTQAPGTPGSLYRPSGPHGQVHGDNPGPTFQTSYYTRASLHPLVAGLVAAVGLGAGLALWQSRAKGDQSTPVREPLAPASDE